MTSTAMRILTRPTAASMRNRSGRWRKPGRGDDTGRDGDRNRKRKRKRRLERGNRVISLPQRPDPEENSFPRSSVGMPSPTLCVVFLGRWGRRGAAGTAFPRRTVGTSSRYPCDGLRKRSRNRGKKTQSRRERQGPSPVSSPIPGLPVPLPLPFLSLSVLFLFLFIPPTPPRNHESSPDPRGSLPDGQAVPCSREGSRGIVDDVSPAAGPRVRPASSPPSERFNGPGRRRGDAPRSRVRADRRVRIRDEKVEPLASQQVSVVPARAGGGLRYPAQRARPPCRPTNPRPRPPDPPRSAADSAATPRSTSSSPTRPT